jgi:hypothetical protein
MFLYVPICRQLFFITVIKEQLIPFFWGDADDNEFYFFFCQLWEYFLRQPFAIEIGVELFLRDVHVPMTGDVGIAAATGNQHDNVSYQMNNTTPMTTPARKDNTMRRRSVDAGTTDREWKLPPMARLGTDQNVMPPLTLILIMSVAPVSVTLKRLLVDVFYWSS